jgi:hypothetical protein
MPYPEIVQIIKQESTALGGDDADSGPDLNYPIDVFEDIIEAAGFEVQEPDGTVRDHHVRLTRLNGDMIFRDVANPTFVTLTDLLTPGGGGLTPATHRPLDQLVHEVAENSFLDIVKTGVKTSSVTYWTDSGKTIKIRESLITRDGNGKVSQTVETQYDAAGNPITGETLTTTLTRVGGKVVNMSIVRS